MTRPLHDYSDSGVTSENERTTIMGREYRYTSVHVGNEITIRRMEFYKWSICGGNEVIIERILEM